MIDVLSDEECEALLDVLAWDARFDDEPDDWRDFNFRNWTWERPAALISTVPLGRARDRMSGEPADATANTGSLKSCRLHVPSNVGRRSS